MGDGEGALIALRDSGRMISRSPIGFTSTLLTLSIGVEDLESALAAGRDAGGHVLNEPSERPELELRLAHLRDPNGVLVELTTPLG